MINKLTHYKKQIKILMFLFLTVSSLLVLNNSLQYNITKSQVDDVHTMNFGINSMYSGEVTTLRVGESTRWLARIIYPVALYYMNSNMGGEVYVTGWEYSSGFYIKKYFKNPASVKHDPNLQDFVFAMKFILGTLVILSFLVASYMLSITYGLIAGISYFIFSFSTSLIHSMLSVFYTESSLIILFNLIIILALVKKVNLWRLYIWSAFILAAAISTKLTGLVFLIPIIMIIKMKDSNLFSGMKIESFILGLIVFLALINIFAVSYISILDQTLANVHHLKTGHRLTVPTGSYQIKKMLHTLTPWIYLFPFALMIIVRNKAKNKIFLFSIFSAVSLMLLSLVNVSFFLERNLTTPLIMILLLVSIALSVLIEKNNYKKDIVLKSIYILIFIFYAYNLNKYNISSSVKSIESHIKSCKNIGSVDVKSSVFNTTILPRMPRTFTLQKEQSKFRNTFAPFDCVVVKRVKNNKYYSNYILPLDFKLTARHGKYFVFKKRK
jgi:hypothetical protein